MNAGILLTLRGDTKTPMDAEIDRISAAGADVIVCVAPDAGGDLWASVRDGFQSLFERGSDVACWLHDDMLPMPGWWEAMIAFLDANTGVGIASPCNPEPLEGCDPFADDGECAVDWTPEQRLEPGAVAPLFIRRECWLNAGGIDPELLCFAPWDLMRKSERVGWDVVTYHGAGVLHAGRQSHLAGLPPLALSRAKNVYKLRHGIALDKDLFEWSEETTCAL